MFDNVILLSNTDSLSQTYLVGTLFGHLSRGLRYILRRLIIVPFSHYSILDTGWNSDSITQAIGILGYLMMDQDRDPIALGLQLNYVTP